MPKDDQDPQVKQKIHPALALTSPYKPEERRWIQARQIIRPQYLWHSPSMSKQSQKPRSILLGGKKLYWKRSYGSTLKTASEHEGGCTTLTPARPRLPRTPSNIELIQNTKLRFEYIGEVSKQSGYGLRELKAARARVVNNWITGINQGKGTAYAYKGALHVVVEELYPDLAGKRLGVYHIVSKLYPAGAVGAVMCGVLGTAAGVIAGFVVGYVVGMVLDALIDLIRRACEVSEKKYWDKYMQIPISIEFSS
ncbi:hypothetical protein FB451DRAFT_1467777 [Mycena latifolia]|nr:hypothetical protein FB451DRAFT_1467777 [Mycena latifolia]